MHKFLLVFDGFGVDLFPFLCTVFFKEHYFVTVPTLFTQVYTYNLSTPQQLELPQSTGVIILASHYSSLQFLPSFSIDL